MLPVRVRGRWARISFVLALFQTLCSGRPWGRHSTGLTFDSWQRIAFSLREFTLLHGSPVFVDISVETNIQRVFVDKSRNHQGRRSLPLKKKCQVRLKGSLIAALVKVTALPGTFSFSLKLRRKRKYKRKVNWIRTEIHFYSWISFVSGCFKKKWNKWKNICWRIITHPGIWCCCKTGPRVKWLHETTCVSWFEPSKASEFVELGSVQQPGHILGSLTQHEAPRSLETWTKTSTTGRASEPMVWPPAAHPYINLFLIF